MQSHCPYCRMSPQLIWVRFNYLIQSIFTAEEIKHFAAIAEGNDYYGE